MRFGFRFELQDDLPEGRVGWVVLLFLALLAGVFIGWQLAVHVRG